MKYLVIIAVLLVAVEHQFHDKFSAFEPGSLSKASGK